MCIRSCSLKDVMHETGSGNIGLCSEGGEAVQSCPTLCSPVDCSLPGSTIHEIFQARILELPVLQEYWVAIS